MRIVRRIVVGLLVFVLVVALLAAGAGVFVVRRSFPVVDGEVEVAGLQAPVDVFRDRWGVPHVYADTAEDLFRAQGYVHAQDRFWQMDFWRHISAGRLAEMFGEDQVDRDVFIRTLGWRRVAEEQWNRTVGAPRRYLQAYADGVNDYLRERGGMGLSLEYALLGVINAGYEVEPWTPVDSLAWLQVMAWDLRGNLEEEIERALLSQTLPVERIEQLWPAYPADHPTIAEGTVANGRFAAAGADIRAVEAPPLPPATRNQLADISEAVRSLDGLVGPTGTGIGSNSWVVDGSRTQTGQPLLANDPHLGPQLPSIWYEVGLHCNERTPECPFTVTGFSFAGVPAVIVGHNHRIAWGVTNLGPDVMDLYIERTDGDRYEVNGRWRDMSVREEVIEVAGGEPVAIEVRTTRHGPVLSDVSEDLQAITATERVPVPEGEHAIALRWTALEPSPVFDALLGLNTAEDWDDFRAAAADFDVPAQNLVYADVEGNIGYQAPGRIPIRANGDGRWPVPGWTDEYEWTGYIPFEELPTIRNPDEGYIVTANNEAVGEGYPYLIASSWAYGYRAERIVDLIQDAGRELTVETMSDLQGDTANLNGVHLRPYAQAMTFEDDALERAREEVAGWNLRQNVSSTGAAIFNAWWRHILARTFHDEMPEGQRPSGDSRWFAVVADLLERPEDPWWDDTSTPEVETRDRILRSAFEDAVAELTERLGDDPRNWRWGDLHTLTLTHQSLGTSGIGLVERLFNRGAYRLAGGKSIVNATGWTATAGYEVDWVPSMRMVVDLADLDGSLSIHLTGQSGHAFHPHYSDMADPWSRNETHLMRWSRDGIEGSAEGHLRLLPAGS